MGCSTAGGNPIRKGRYSRLRGSELSAAPAGRPTTKVTSTVCVAIASMRSAFSQFNSPTRWRPVLCFVRTRRILKEKVSFFTSYLYHVNAGDLVFDFVLFTVCCSFVMKVMSIPSFFDRLPSNNRHGDAAPEWAGERAPGMSPCKEQVC